MQLYSNYISSIYKLTHILHLGTLCPSTQFALEHSVSWNTLLPRTLCFSAGCFSFWNSSDILTKFEKNLLHKIWRYWVASNFMWKIFSNFMPFSEYPNFKACQRVNFVEKESDLGCKVFHATMNQSVPKKQSVLGSKVFVSLYTCSLVQS